jgi:hypothetical protein
MLRIALLAFIALTAFSQTPGLNYTGPRCLPKAFISKSFVINPMDNFFDETTIWYDEFRQNQRVDIKFNNPGETPTNITVFLFPNIKKAYRIFDNGASCVSSFYETQMKALCFNPQARPLREVRLGRQTLLEFVLETDSTMETYQVFPSGNLLLSVSIFSRAKVTPNMLSNFIQYFDTQVSTGSLPDQSVFTLPAVCQGK